MEVCVVFCFFFFQAEDGIRDLVRSRGLGDVYKRQPEPSSTVITPSLPTFSIAWAMVLPIDSSEFAEICLLYTSDAADERSSVDLGGRRIIKQKNKRQC